jgi:Mg-chelatase subunit ChlD
MTGTTLPPLSPEDLRACAPTDEDGGFGALRTERGNLPLSSIRVEASITGLTSRVRLSQRFVNPHPEPLEATYVFPLPDRGAVTAMSMTADGRTVVARLRERAAARAEYDAAIAAGQRASIAEEERPDVFTLRVGNILPGEQVTVEITVVGVLPVADGVATFRFPLVVAPRYVPGSPLPSDAVGAGYHPDTDAVPDASRITPPVLLPGFPHPVRLEAEVALDPAGLGFGTPRVSLHAVRVEGGAIRFEPGQRVDRDIVLRIPLEADGAGTAGLVLVPDPPGSDRPAEPVAGTDQDDGEGTFQLTVLPPPVADTVSARDIVLLLDRSGSMAGWKLVAARRAAARIVDTLTERDRFAVLAYDHEVQAPVSLPAGLVPGTDRNRFRAVEFLAGLDARGGTELDEPLRRALALLAGEPAVDAGDVAHAADVVRSRVLVLVTDGQVGNEDQLLASRGRALADVRVHTVGIDQAVNAGFLGRLASLGGGRCELVESEDRLDEAMAAIHRRIGSPAVTDLRVTAAGVAVLTDTIAPGGSPDLFPGVPCVLRGRYRDAHDARVTLTGAGADGEPWSVTVDGRVGTEPAVTAAWARDRVRDLEDRYVIDSGALRLEESPVAASLERGILRTSLRFGVLCRFTAFVAVDERVVTDGTAPRVVVQPVELPAGWSEQAVRPAFGVTGGVRMRRMGAPQGFAPAAPAASLSAAPAPGSPPPFAPRAAGTVLGGELAELLDREVVRLGSLTGRPVRECRDALTDLRSRLTAVADREGPHGRLWGELLDVLGRCDRTAPDQLGGLIAEVSRLLEELRDRLVAPADVDPRSPWAGKPWRPGQKRPAFWKHFPDR